MFENVIETTIVCSNLLVSISLINQFVDNLTYEEFQL